MTAPLAVPAMNRHSAMVIFLHGLGDQGADWINIVVNWRRDLKFTETKFIFPNALFLVLRKLSRCYHALVTLAMLFS